MIRIEGFDITGEIHHGTRSRVYRGRRKSDDLPVVVKTHAGEFPSHAEIKRYEHEFEIGGSIRDDHVIRYLALVPCNNGKAIIKEAHGEADLKHYIGANTISTGHFLEIAIQLARGLDAIHKARVIHRDVKPANITIDSRSREVKIIDFSVSSRAPREIGGMASPVRLEGTLPYISPEQTGRMNRPVDFRSDFYSLGVTFFEMLTGRLPFTSPDPMELIHAHIARLPPPPHAEEPETPRMISDIVMKLLSKAAEDRYQGCPGLAADLERCAREIEKSGWITVFTPGAEDVSDTFHIPRKLYGRDKEIETLLDVFESVRGGEKRMLLVSGGPGVGKSALVREVVKPVTLANGCFFSGGFEELKQGTPYFGFIDVFRGLIREILSEPDAGVEAWKTRILAALGSNARILVDVIPDLESITGPTPPAPDLGPAEAKIRFNHLLQNLIRALCRPERPIVIFLENLQYADPASLELIERAMTDPEVNTLLLAGTRGTIEAPRGEGPTAMLARLEKSGEAPVRIALTPLGVEPIADMAADALQCGRDAAVALAKLVHEKTGGAPRFARLFLNNLYEEGLIRFETPTDAAPGWRWNPSDVEKRAVTDNVAELSIQKLAGLPEPTRRALQLAACLGARFRLEELESVFEMEGADVSRALRPAVEEGLAAASRTSEPVEDDSTDGSFDFVHDDVRSAAYALMDEDDRKKAHLKIGEAMLARIPGDRYGDKIFDIASHLNLGSDAPGRGPAPGKMAELNLLAARRAKKSNAHASSLHYLQAGIDLLETHGLKRSALSRALRVEAAEVSFLAHDYEKMEEHVREALALSKTPRERLRVHEIEIHASVARNNMQQAIRIGLALLRSLDVRFPKRPTRWSIALEFAKTGLALAGKRIEDLEKLPEMTDPDKILAVRLMWKIHHAAFVARPELYIMLVLRALRLFIRFGVTEKWLCFSHFGFLLCGVLGDVERGIRFGRLDRTLLSRFETCPNKADVATVYNVLIRGWREHLGAALPAILTSHRVGLENGELQISSINLYIYGLFSFLTGKELNELRREMDEHLRTLISLKHEMSIHIQGMNRRMVANFMEESDDPCALSDDAFDEREMLAYYEKEKDLNARINYHFCKSILGYYFGDYPRALENLAREEACLKKIPTTAAHATFAFYDSLARLAVFPGASPSGRRAISRKVRSNQKKMKKWAAGAPMNFLHKYCLVEAEKRRVQGGDGAMELYERAMALAREHGWLHEEALANELCAEFWLGRGKRKIARLYFTEAHYLYTRWGAMAKVRELENRRPDLAAPPPAQPAGETGHTTESSTLSLSTYLDMNTVMKAAQAISGEIDLDRLMTRMMKIILETAGARRGFLIRRSEGGIYVDASGDVESEEVKTFWSVRLDDCPDLCTEIVRHVIRTGENVVIHDASRRERFARSRYILERGPKSILCTPLLRKNDLVGVLYLENNLTSAAFTEDRIETLHILLAQAAISLENAELYKKSRLAEKDARESEAHFRGLFEQSNDAICILDFKANILDVNGRACEMLGCSREQLLAMRVDMVLAEGMLPDVLKAFRTCGKEGSVMFETIFATADGSRIDVEISARITDREKGLIQAVIRDITERNRTWEMMIQNEKMMTVGGLAAGMAHEINNPLGGILQNVQVMQKRLSDRMPKNRRAAEECGVTMEAVRSYMEKRGFMTMMDMIMDAGARARKIVDNMLDFSRASEARLSPCDLSEVLDDSVHLAGSDYDSKKKFDFRRIEIIREYEGAMPSVMCERGRIQQVLINILKNGAQAMAENPGGEPPRFILRLRREGDAAVIEIEDNGPGMEEGVRKRVFDPFFTTKKVGVGTGLGLSVSYFIITENHGGSLEAASKPGEGATFIIRLPITE